MEQCGTQRMNERCEWTSKRTSGRADCFLYPKRRSHICFLPKVQAIHFIYAFLQLNPLLHDEKEIEFVVPTGACGNVSGGCLAGEIVDGRVASIDGDWRNSRHMIGSAMRDRKRFAGSAASTFGTSIRC